MSAPDRLRHPHREHSACACGHCDDDHNGTKGSCLVTGCRCLRFRAEARPRGMRRRPKAKPAIDERRAEAWVAGARRKPCAVCRREHGKGRVIEGHHIIRQQTLEDLARDLGLDYERIRWDERNRLPLCDVCHGNHTNASRRVTREVLERAAPKVFQFAAELDRRHPRGAEPATFEIDNHYPQEGSHGR